MPSIRFETWIKGPKINANDLALVSGNITDLFNMHLSTLQPFSIGMGLKRELESVHSALKDQLKCVLTAGLIFL